MLPGLNLPGDAYGFYREVGALKNKAGLGERLAALFDLPQETLGTLPRVTISGCSRAMVENHRGLLAYTGELVIVNGGRVQVKLRGDRLRLERMDKEELIVTGQIFSAEIE